MNLPDISYQDTLRKELQSMNGWEKLSGFDKEYETEMFMQRIGKMFLEYFQFHLQEATTIAEPFEEDLLKAMCLINRHYVYRLQLKFGTASSWDDVWPRACETATNIDAFAMLFGEIVGELDAVRIWEYVEERKEIESLEPEQRPKNAPKYHWWWFTEYKPKGTWP